MSAFSKLVSAVCDRPDGAAVSGVSFADRLDALALEHPDAPEWRKSIVDLLKTAGLDASYGARKKLALELGYTEDQIVTQGSTEMNQWLRGEVWKRLADAGATLPPDLLP
jgi:hypothetical protein